MPRISTCAVTPAMMPTIIIVSISSINVKPRFISVVCQKCCLCYPLERIVTPLDGYIDPLEPRCSQGRCEIVFIYLVYEYFACVVGAADQDVFAGGIICVLNIIIAAIYFIKHNSFQTLTDKKC